MNAHDSEWLAEALRDRGLAEAPLSEARFIIINTCSVRKKPEEKVRSLLGRIRAMTKNSEEVCVCVCGCVAQQLGEKLFNWSKQVRIVAGTDQISCIPAYIEKTLDNPDERIVKLDFDEIYREREQLPGIGSSSFVSIMQGCDNFCSYCIVPFTRGRQKSRKKSEIIQECQNRLRQGTREIILLGQNVNAWGKDNGQDSFASLLREIAALPNLVRLRYITPHPRDMTTEDLQVFADTPVLAPHLHLPLQSGSDRVLKAMRRRYDYAGYRKLIADLRSLRPDITFTTDIIIGFPGETEEDFDLTLAALHDCAFVNSFSFCYSDRPGARASFFPDKIPAPVQRDRLLRYQRAQEIIAEKWLTSRIGGEALVMLENESARAPQGANSWQGRDEYGVIVHVDMGSAAPKRGELVKCAIKSAKRHSLVGQAMRQRI